LKSTALKYVAPPNRMYDSTASPSNVANWNFALSPNSVSVNDASESKSAFW
jgi:hypothetical protein